MFNIQKPVALGKLKVTFQHEFFITGCADYHLGKNLAVGLPVADCRGQHHKRPHRESHYAVLSVWGWPRRPGVGFIRRWGHVTVLGMHAWHCLSKQCQHAQHSLFPLLSMIYVDNKLSSSYFLQKPSVHWKGNHCYFKLKKKKINWKIVFLLLNYSFHVWILQNLFSV